MNLVHESPISQNLYVREIKQFRGRIHKNIRNEFCDEVNANLY